MERYKTLKMTYHTPLEHGADWLDVLNEREKSDHVENCAVESTGVGPQLTDMEDVPDDGGIRAQNLGNGRCRFRLRWDGCRQSVDNAGLLSVANCR